MTLLAQIELPIAMPDDPLVLWLAFVAPFLPGLIAFVNQVTWPSWAKLLIAFGSSAGVGAVIAVIMGRVDRADVLRSAHVCLFLTQLIYRLAQVGPAKEIEAATSLPQR